MNTGAVIVTYRTRPSTLRACLQSLKDNRMQDIVIIDNEHNPAVKNVAQKKSIKYFPQPQNLGFAAAANLGAARLASKYLLFINPDAALSKHACANAETHLNNHPKTGIVGLLLYTPNGQIQPHSFGSAVTPLSLVARHFPRVKPKNRSPLSVGWVSGGAMIMRRSLFMQIKGFDARFFLYWEDVDLCRRAIREGQRVVVLPSAAAIHRRGASLLDSKLKTKLYDKSAGIYFCKHYSKTICSIQKFCRYLYRFISPRAD